MWYRAQDGERHRPVGAGDIETAIAAGAISGETLLWRKGLEAWQPAGAIPEFKAAFRAARADQPPPLPPLTPAGPPRAADAPPLPPASSPGGGACGDPAAANSDPAGTLAEEFELRLKHAAAPWSRYWARMLDSMASGLIALVVLVIVGMLAPNSAIVRESGAEGAEALWTIGFTALVCVFTAVCLRLFGTTPGKALYRIDVTPMRWTGNSTSFAGREMRVFFAGLGIGFPLVSLFTMFWQHSRIKRAQPASYDDGKFLVTQRPIGAGRFWLGVALVVLGLFSFVAIGVWGEEVERKASIPQTFANTATGKSASLPAGWQLGDTAGTEREPVWVLAHSTDGSAAVFGLEHLPDGFSDSEVYANAVAASFGPSGSNDLKILFDPCRPAQSNLVGGPAMRCTGTQVASGAPAEIIAFLDPPRAWRIVLLNNSASTVPWKDILVSVLVLTTKD